MLSVTKFALYEVSSFEQQTLWPGPLGTSTSGTLGTLDEMIKEVYVMKGGYKETEKYWDKVLSKKIYMILLKSYLIQK